MTVKEIVAHFLADPDNRLVALLKSKGVKLEDMENVLHWIVEVNICNFMHIAYDERGIIDIVDDQQRRFMVRPDIWNSLEQRAKKTPMTKYG